MDDLMGVPPWLRKPPYVSLRIASLPFIFWPTLGGSSSARIIPAIVRGFAMFQKIISGDITWYNHDNNPTISPQSAAPLLSHFRNALVKEPVNLLLIYIGFALGSWYLFSAPRRQRGARPRSRGVNGDWNEVRTMLELYVIWVSINGSAKWLVYNG